MSLFKLFNYIYESKYNESDFIIINEIPNPPQLDIIKTTGISFNIKYKYKNFNEYKNFLYIKNRKKIKNKSRRSRKKRLKNTKL